MRLSQVPVQSLCRHGLLFDPGGRSTGLPIAPAGMLRSGSLKPSAFPDDRSGNPPSSYPHGPRLSNNFRGSITHPADLLGPAHDPHFLRPQGFATGLVANLCPERTSTSWIAKTNFREGATPASQGYGLNLTRQRLVMSPFNFCTNI